MPLTTRLPQNGGVGIGTSTATSERAATGSVSRASALALRSAAIRSDRSRRALRSAALASASGSTTGDSPRLAAMIASISRRPSNASRA